MANIAWDYLYLQKKFMDSATNISPLWYAIRVTYNRELKVKAFLDSKGIENFIPMHFQDVTINKKKVRKLIPTIHNLIFIHMSESEIKELKSTTNLPIRYIMNKETKKPLIIPERQMNDFIAVSATNEESLIYLTPEDLKLKKGDKVKIIGGIFEGCEGTLMRIKGDRRVVVEIPGIIAVATAFIHPSLIIKIQETNEQ